MDVWKSYIQLLAKLQFFTRIGNLVWSLLTMSLLIGFLFSNELIFDSICSIFRLYRECLVWILGPDSFLHLGLWRICWISNMRGTGTSDDIKSPRGSCTSKGDMVEYSYFTCTSCHTNCNGCKYFWSSKWIDVSSTQNIPYVIYSHIWNFVWNNDSNIMWRTGKNYQRCCWW